MKEFSVLGKSVPRQDAQEKVTGAAKFIDDLKFGPNTLYAKILRSPYAHAKIISIDTSAAEKLPGVKAIITGKDCPDNMGLYLADRTIYAVDRVRFVGEPVAGVAATTENIAQQAVGLIKVEYEELPGVFDPITGVKVGSSDLSKSLATNNKDPWWQDFTAIRAQGEQAGSILHEKLSEYSCVPFIFPVPGTNISNHFKIRKGDIEQGFAEADVIVENAYYVPHIQHCAIEPHAAVAYVDHAGKLTLWASSQSPNAVRKMIAVAFNLPMTKLRVITPFVGGGFGGKAGVTTEALVVPLAMKLHGYYIKLALTREEVFQCTFVRQGMLAKYKTGATKDGKLVALDCELYWDGGAYTEYGVNITRSGGYCSSGPYEIPNIKTDSYCVYTNHPTGGPMRGFGMPEIHWAIECQMDEVAKALNMDSLKFRHINALREGRPAAFGGPMFGASLVDTIEAVEKKSGWHEPRKKTLVPNKVRGRGIACMYKAPSMPPDAQSSAIIKFNEDGSAHLLTTSSDIGQGSQTALAQVAAETIGIPIENVKVDLPDTDYTPYEWQTVASRISFSAGNAVYRAALDAKTQLVSTAAKIFGVTEDDIEIKDGYAFVRYNPEKSMAVKDFAMGYLMPNGAVGAPVIGRGAFIPAGLTGLDQETGQGERPAPFWTYGTQAVEIEVDTQTGEITVDKVTAAYEVGKVINPEMCKAQVQGGIIQGLSSALYEQLQLDHGKPLNNDFVDYKIATATDTPKMDVILLETKPQVDGPYGIKGIAEPTMVPTAPAIANAVYDAIGVRIRDLPLTAEKVLKALQAKNK